MAKGKKTSSIWGEVGAATVGMAIGGALGVLFAPEKGNKLRGRIAKGGKKAVSRVNRLAKEVGARVNKAESKGTAKKK